MFIKNRLLIAASLVAAARVAYGAGANVADASPIFQSSRFEAGLFTGYLAGTVREFVYDDDGSKLSQLNWRINNAATAGFNVAYRPLGWLALRAEAWTTVASNGTLTDYDWLFRDAGIHDWSDRSISPLKRMNRTLSADFSAAATFYRSGGLSMDALIGVRYLTMKFTAHGGTYISSDENDPASFRGEEGNLPPGPVINYRQTWRSGYLGAAMRYGVGKFNFYGQVIASPWTYGKDRDEYLLRDAVFQERSERSSMFGMQAGIDYQLAPHWTLSSTLSYEKFAHARASTYQVEDGIADYHPVGSAGLSNETWGLRLGAKFVF